MLQGIRQTRMRYRAYAAGWSRMPGHLRFLVGLLGAGAGWLAYVAMAALAPVTRSGRLDAGLPVLSVVIVVLVNIAGQHLGYRLWLGRRGARR